MQTEITRIFTPPKTGDALRPTYFSDVSLLTFSLTSGTGDLAIGSYSQPPQAPASGQLPYPYAYGGDKYLGLNFTVPAAPGTHQNYVLLHEIGHALGLEHGNIYPPTNSVPNSPHLDPKFDNMKYTIMSYNPDPNAVGTYPIGLQQFDIAALQEMYGTNYNTRSEDTTYTFSKSPGITTIWDGGGKDKIDAQSFTQRVTIDLQPGKFSSIGAKDNVAMALVSHLATENQTRPLIENARGGSGDDELIGNRVSNILEGGQGKNGLYGLGGNDILVSEGTGDTLHGGVGNDALGNR